MARTFTATTTYIDIGAVTTPTTAITLAGWFFPTETFGTNQQDAYLIGKRHDAPTNASYNLSPTASSVSWEPQFRVGFGGVANSAQAAATVIINTWNHFAGTWESGDFVRVFFNGAQLATSASTLSGTISYTAQNSYIGYNSSGIKVPRGRIADVCMWDVRLTANELLSLFRGTLPTSIRFPNIVRYFPVWGLHSPEIDLSQNSSTGTINGTLNQSNGPPTTLSTRQNISYFDLPAAAGNIFDDTLTLAASGIEARSLQAALASASLLTSTGGVARSEAALRSTSSILTATGALNATAGKAISTSSLLTSAVAMSQAISPTLSASAVLTAKADLTSLFLASISTSIQLAVNSEAAGIGLDVFVPDTMGVRANLTVNIGKGFAETLPLVSRSDLSETSSSIVAVTKLLAVSSRGAQASSITLLSDYSTALAARSALSPTAARSVNTSFQLATQADQDQNVGKLSSATVTLNASAQYLTTVPRLLAEACLLASRTQLSSTPSYALGLFATLGTLGGLTEAKLGIFSQSASLSSRAALSATAQLTYQHLLSLQAQTLLSTTSALELAPVYNLDVALHSRAALTTTLFRNVATTVSLTAKATLSPATRMVLNVAEALLARAQQAQLAGFQLTTDTLLRSRATQTQAAGFVLGADVLLGSRAAITSQVLRELQVAASLVTQAGITEQESASIASSLTLQILADIQASSQQIAQELEVLGVSANLIATSGYVYEYTLALAVDALLAQLEAHLPPGGMGSLLADIRIVPALLSAISVRPALNADIKIHPEDADYSPGDD